MKIRQAELVNSKGKHMICWFSGWEKCFRLKIGLVVNLDGDYSDIDWTITKLFGVQEHGEINRHWNVGGLKE